MGSFEVLNDMWARDGNHVFTGGTMLRGLEAREVKVLSLCFATDGAVAASWHGIIKDADAAAFRALDVGAVPDHRNSTDEWLVEGYAADENSVWFYMASCGQAKKLKGVDVRTFRALEFGFGKDTDSVFFETFRIRGADARKFKVLDCGYAMDGARVFYGQTEVEGADPSTFEIVDPGNWIARDARSYWQRDEKMQKPPKAGKRSLVAALRTKGI